MPHMYVLKNQPSYVMGMKVVVARAGKKEFSFQTKNEFPVVFESADLCGQKYISRRNRVRHFSQPPLSRLCWELMRKLS